MSNSYVTKVTLLDGQVVLTVQVEEFQPGESLEISGHATQDGGALAVFYDIQPVPAPNPDGATYIYLKASPSQEFKKGHDVTVVLRAARVWATVLGESEGEPQTEQQLSPQRAELAEEGTTWNDIKAVVSADAGPSPMLQAGQAATGSEASFPAQ